MKRIYILNCKKVFCLCKWIFLFVWTGCFSINYSIANGPVYTHIFTDEEQKKVAFGDSLYIFVDQGGTYDIRDIVDSDEIVFQKIDSTMRVEPPFTVWTKLILRNEGSSARHDYFSFCLESDSNWVYVIKDGRIVDEQFTGRWINPSEKSFPSMYAYLPASIEAGEEKVYYLRSLFTKPVGAEHFTHVYIQPAKPLLHHYFNSFVWQAFYAGIMLFFCGFSLFMFVVFRENIFIYFASITMFFALYFVHLQGMDSAFLSTWFERIYLPFGHFIISGLILSIFLYANGYVRIKEKLPKYFPYFLAATIVVISYGHLFKLFGMDLTTLSISHNILLFVWVFLLVIPLIFLTIKKDIEARVLLISLGILFIGAVLFLTSFNRANPRGSWLHYSFQMGSIAFSGILFYGLFDKINTIRREQRRMSELDKLKSTFFANISHEFRTPLTLMKGPLQEVMDSTDDPKTLRLLTMAYRNTDRQLQLVNQLLDLSKLDAGKMELRAHKENFVPFLKGVVHAYQSLAIQKDIDLKLVCPIDDLQLYFNRDKMEKILYNLLSNAFKFTSTGGKVIVELKKNGGYAVVRVSDTGTGIASNEIPHIFDRFFQSDLNKNTEVAGSGIGLALVKELVQLHGGTIAVSSKVGHGTTFTLEFPIGRQHLTKEAVIDDSQDLSESLPVDFPKEMDAAISPLAAPSKPVSNEVPHLLVIEDNTDVRSFIRLRLEQSFHISEAINGQQGIDMAVELMPDIIISDVMMPEKDGFEVCKTLKSDIRTCHIPIILLTARAAHKAKMEGLETGADDYLTKPFNSEELELRALNLVRLRRQLKERFAETITLRPSEMATNSLDQSFLEDILNVVEANLANDQFGIDTLVEELGMSKSNINRKLRALLNQSTNQFIQSIRLQRAFELLEQHAGTVSEVAFQIGFGSTAYFVKCFKEKYGKTPGTVLKNE